jgi:hypothetical protein
MKDSTTSTPPMDDSNSSDIVVHVPSLPNFIDNVRLQHLWLALHRRPWRSLAVMSATKGVATIEVSNTLAKMAWWYAGKATCVLDMRDLSLRLVKHQLDDMAAQFERAQRVFLALRSAAENPTAVLVARAADATVLCVELGKTNIKEALATIEAVGRDRVLGTILVSGFDIHVADDGAPPPTEATSAPEADDAVARFEAPSADIKTDDGE